MLHRSVANFAKQNMLRCSRYSQKYRHSTAHSTMCTATLYYFTLYSARDIPALKHELWSLSRCKTIPFQLESALRNIYNYLQRFAVGLEEIVLDQALFDGEFIQEFNEAEYKLKAVSVSAV